MKIIKCSLLLALSALLSLTIKAQCDAFAIEPANAMQTRLLGVDIYSGETNDLGVIEGIPDGVGVGLVDSGDHLYLMMHEYNSTPVPSNDLFHLYKLGYNGDVIDAYDIPINQEVGGCLSMNAAGDGVYFILDAIPNAFGHYILETIFATGQSTVIGILSADPDINVGITGAAMGPDNYLYINSYNDNSEFRIQKIDVMNLPPADLFNPLSPEIVYSCIYNEVNQSSGMDYNACDGNFYFIYEEVCGLASGVNLYTFNAIDLVVDFVSNLDPMTDKVYQGLSFGNTNPPVTIDLGPDIIGCPDTYSITGPVGFSNYEWSQPLPNECVVNGSTILACQEGEYCLTATDPSSGQTITGCVNVEYYSPLVVSSDIQVCVDQAGEGSYPISVSGGSGNGQWSSTAGTVLNANETSSAITGIPFGTTAVTWTDSECGSIATINIELNQNPTGEILLVDEGVKCYGEPVPITVLTTGDGPFSYFYNPCDYLVQSYSTSSNTSNVYADFEGDFCVWISDANGCTGETNLNIEREECGCALNPVISAVPHDVDCHEIEFAGIGNPGSFTSVVGYVWDFGDGETGTGEEIDHDYAQEGTYTVTLSIMGTNEEGDCCTVTVSEVVTVDCECTADAVFVLENSLCQVTANYSGLTDPTTIINYTWDMGNGTLLSGESIDYVYPEPGNYTVSLTILAYDENETCSSTYSENIEINCPQAVNCDADISINHMIIVPNETYVIWADILPGEGTTVYGYSWYLDGELISNEEEAFADLPLGSVYEVCLVLKTTFDGACCEKTYCDVINLIPLDCNSIISSVDFNPPGDPFAEWDGSGFSASNFVGGKGCTDKYSVRIRRSGKITNQNLDVSQHISPKISFCYVNDTWPNSGGWDGNDQLILEGKSSSSNAWTVIETYGSTPTYDNITVNIPSSILSSGMIDLRFRVNTSGGNPSNKWSWLDNIVVFGCLNPGTAGPNDANTTSQAEFKTLDENKTIAIYPNPTDASVMVQIPDVYKGVGEVVVLDARGNEVLREIVLADRKNEQGLLINTSKLAIGTYVLKVKHATGVETSQLVILR